MNNIFDSDLNEFSNSFKVQDNRNLKKLNAVIKYGDFLECIKNGVMHLAPNGIVCFVSIIETFKQYGQEIMSAIGVKNINVVLGKNGDNGIENISGLFNLSEEIRAVVLIDNELLSITKYFCGLRNLPLIFAPKNTYISDILNEQINITLNKNSESANFDNYKYIILDKKLLALSDMDSIRNAYSEILSKRTALIDYKAKCVILDKKADEEMLTYAFMVIEDTYKILSYKEKNDDYFLRLSENILRLEILNYITYGELLNNTSEISFGKLLMSLKKKNVSYSVCKLLASQILINVYQLFFLSDINIFLKTPCLVERSEIFSKLTGNNKKQILESLVKNSFQNNIIEEKINANKKDFIVLIDKLILLNNLSNIYQKIMEAVNIKTKFSGSEIKKCLYSAPDFRNSITALSLMRDVGALEYLNY